MDKGIETLRKTKKDLVWSKRRLAESNDPIEKEILALIIEQEKAWLAKWDLQNKVAMRGNNKA